LSNACRHSGAQRVVVELRRTPSTIVLDIHDDGCGFDRRAVPPGRFGLRGIEERARLFGGRAQIESAPGQGTRIHVEMSLDAQEATAAPSAMSNLAAARLAT
jgi:signal transduction histidine kinase